MQGRVFALGPCSSNKAYPAQPQVGDSGKRQSYRSTCTSQAGSPRAYCSSHDAFLVPGDIITLSAGDMIPGDVRVLSSKDLFVSQGSLTGESMPVEKNHDAEPGADAKAVSSPAEIRNTCFMGTSVESGTATAVVVTTGINTYLGSMAGAIAEEPAPTSFDVGLNRFTWLMIRLMAVMVPLVFLINGFTKHDWKSAFFSRWRWPWGLRPRCCR